MVRSSAAENTGCMPGSYLRRKLVVPLKQFLQPRPLVKNLQPHDHMSFSAAPINTDKEIENKFFVFGHVKMLLKNISTLVSSSAEVYNDEASHFSG